MTCSTWPDQDEPLEPPRRACLGPCRPPGARWRRSCATRGRVPCSPGGATTDAPPQPGARRAAALHFNFGKKASIIAWLRTGPRVAPPTPSAGLLNASSCAVSYPSPRSALLSSGSDIALFRCTSLFRRAAFRLPTTVTGFQPVPRRSFRELWRRGYTKLTASIGAALRL
jgi:hypothetical protein